MTAAVAAPMMSAASAAPVRFLPPPSSRTPSATPAPTPTPYSAVAWLPPIASLTQTHKRVRTEDASTPSDDMLEAAEGVLNRWESDGRTLRSLLWGLLAVEQRRRGHPAKFFRSLKKACDRPASGIATDVVASPSHPQGVVWSFRTRSPPEAAPLPTTAGLCARAAPGQAFVVDRNPAPEGLASVAPLSIAPAPLPGPRVATPPKKRPRLDSALNPSEDDRRNSTTPSVVSVEEEEDDPAPIRISVPDAAQETTARVSNALSRLPPAPSAPVAAASPSSSSSSSASASKAGHDRHRVVSPHKDFGDDKLLEAAQRYEPRGETEECVVSLLGAGRTSGLTRAQVSYRTYRAATLVSALRGVDRNEEEKRTAAELGDLLDAVGADAAAPSEALAKAIHTDDFRRAVLDFIRAHESRGENETALGVFAFYYYVNGERGGSGASIKWDRDHGDRLKRAGLGPNKSRRLYVCGSVLRRCPKLLFVDPKPAQNALMRLDRVMRPGNASGSAHDSDVSAGESDPEPSTPDAPREDEEGVKGR